MKIISYLSVFFIFLQLSVSAASKDSTETADKNYPLRKLTIEPAIGLNPFPTADLVFSNVIQWNLTKRFCVVSHTSYAYNNVTQRDYNNIKTEYNYTLGQKFGVGTSLYLKHSSHTFSLLAGIRYDAYEETLKNPDFEQVSASVSSAAPDVGLMYNLKVGKKKYFFSYRMYIPLYPYPIKSSDVNAIDANQASLSMEFGVGIHLK